VANLRRAAAAEQEEVRALDIRQHQGARDPVEHIGRRHAASALPKPCITGRAGIAALRHLLAAQARRAATLPGKAERRRIELR
jgi:hypothetical protein